MFNVQCVVYTELKKSPKSVWKELNLQTDGHYFSETGKTKVYWRNRLIFHEKQLLVSPLFTTLGAMHQNFKVIDWKKKKLTAGKMSFLQMLCAHSQNVPTATQNISTYLHMIIWHGTGCYERLCNLCCMYRAGCDLHTSAIQREGDLSGWKEVKTGMERSQEQTELAPE